MEIVKNIIDNILNVLKENKIKNKKSIGSPIIKSLTSINFPRVLFIDFIVI